MERAMGIEPTSEAWEASILPLYDARSAVKLTNLRNSCKNSSRALAVRECAFAWPAGRLGLPRFARVHRQTGAREGAAAHHRRRREAASDRALAFLGSS